MFCEKCRTAVDESGRAEDGYFTCGYGGSHRPVARRPVAAARISRSNRRNPPRRRGAKRQVIRRQEAEDAREQGRTERLARATDALKRHVATSRASEREGQSGVLRG